MYIFNKKKPFFSSNSVIADVISKNCIMQDEYKGPIKYYPSSSKEWFNSIYAYNKSYTKLMVYTDKIINNLLKNYINMIIDKIKIRFKSRNPRKSRLSSNKVYVSRAEIKHTNTKVVITLYIYNKQKYYLKRKLINIVKNIDIKKRKQLSFILKLNNMFTYIFKNMSVNLKKSLVLSYIFRKRFSYFNKSNFTFVKKINNILILYLLKINKIYPILHKKYLIFNKKLISKIRYIYFILCKKHNLIFNYEKLLSKVKYVYFILRVRHNIIFINKLLLLEEKFINTAKLLNFNRSKFTNLFLNSEGLGIINLISLVYNKKVELKIVELKSLHLNSDIFSFAIASKLRNRKNRVSKILRKALSKIKLPSLHLLLTGDNDINSLNKNNVLKYIKQKVISGIRFEASGRLTRRLTASRSVFKYRYIGSIRNLHSSYNNLSSVMLRGHIKSNLQYTLINSKTRNGTFGLKGWVSSH